jgi:hypothetical protein
MDDYRDLVAAGFALLCAALALVAGLLFVTHWDVQTAPGTTIELPTKGGSTFPLILSESRCWRSLEDAFEVVGRHSDWFCPAPSREFALLVLENHTQ